MFFNFIKDVLIFCLIFQNSNVQVISQFQWPISATGESSGTFDVIPSTKPVFFKSSFDERQQLRSFHTARPASWIRPSQITCPSVSLEICGIFLYGVTTILFLLRKVCEERLENYRNLGVRMYWYINTLGPYDIAPSHRRTVTEFRVTLLSVMFRCLKEQYLLLRPLNSI